MGKRGNVAACPSCPKEVREELWALEKNKKQKHQFQSVGDYHLEEDDCWEIEALTPRHITTGKNKAPLKGPIDLFCKRLESAIAKNRKETLKQASIRQACDKEAVARVHQYIARFWYQAWLSFNMVKLESFCDMIAAIGSFGPHLPPPSYHDIRVPLLQKEVEHTNEMLKGQREHWENFGCSIMSDAWTDKKQRSIINFLVNSSTGTTFIKSVDASNFVKTGDKLFELLDSIIEEIGEENVVQVITDNGSNYVLAGKKIEEKRPKIYWTPCAAHCIDLMLEDIGKISTIKKTIQRAISLVERLHQEKVNLRQMFVSDERNSNKLSKEAKGKEAYKTVTMPSFWRNIVYILKVMAPLVKVLRTVDGERNPAMGYIYEAMDKAKEAIMKSFDSNESKYKEVFDIIDRRWNVQLHRPLHAAFHFLNPEYYYDNPQMEFDSEVIRGLYSCINKLVGDLEVEQKIMLELHTYKTAGDEMFGSPLAISMRKTISSAQWWRLYGSSCPNLQKQIHTKRRNRLEHKKLHDLVYVKYNQALLRRYNIKDEVDPISLNEIDECNEWLVGEMEDGDERVFGGDDTLTWPQVYKASGVGKPRMYTRSKKRKVQLAKGGGMSSQMTSKGNSGAASSRRGKKVQIEEDTEDISEESEEEAPINNLYDSSGEEAEGYASFSDKENDYIGEDEGNDEDDD
ncbi:hypothetical protein CASFOL_027304 [Castilleja foliolosa]|uniref:DUF659 domain-containing protein n=1 Tax=Castilleja foliolosa TaxID=1961234 RepID=A0ABD3CEF4_9LAMI